MKKALTIMEPHASLLLSPWKTIETRSWKTNYRGELYLHASKRVQTYNDETRDMWERCLALYRKYEEHTGTPLTLHAGLIYAKAELTDCVLMTEENIMELKERRPAELDAGFYSPGRYMWILKNVKALQDPIHANGHLGIWNWKGVSEG